MTLAIRPGLANSGAPDHILGGYDRKQKLKSEISLQTDLVKPKLTVTDRCVDTGWPSNSRWLVAPLS